MHPTYKYVACFRNRERHKHRIRTFVRPMPCAMKIFIVTMRICMSEDNGGPKRRETRRRRRRRSGRSRSVHESLGTRPTAAGTSSRETTYVSPTGTFEGFCAFCKINIVGQSSPAVVARQREFFWGLLADAATSCALYNRKDE